MLYGGGKIWSNFQSSNMKLAFENFTELLTHSDEGIPGCDNVSLGSSKVIF